MDDGHPTNHDSARTAWWVDGLVWLLFVAWLVGQVPFFLRLVDRGISPIDFGAYERAAAAIAQQQSPYDPSSDSIRVWRYYHRVESELQAAYARGEHEPLERALAKRTRQPGPYLYPPTLALWIKHLHVSALEFAAITLTAVLGFAWLWLTSARASSTWLLTIPLSRDLLAPVQGGNVEVLLLFLALLAARLIWSARLLVAAPIVACIVLIKPFYALFFFMFLVLRWISDPAALRLRSALLAGCVTLAVLLLEVWHWGPALQKAALEFASEGWNSLWLTLPVAEQTPMSAWNRTPLQALVNAGASLETARAGALALWLLLFGVTLWHVRGRPVAFPVGFALALTLFYWARPIGWGFVYLELVVAVAVWPSLRQPQRLVLMVGVLAVLASRWWALHLSLTGAGLSLLLTLQSPTLAWETWLILPAAWLLLLYASTYSSRQRRTSEANVADSKPVSAHTR